MYFTAPALATFTKLQLLNPDLATGIIGKAITEVNALEWVQKWSSVGFLQVIDGNGDGILQLNEFFMRGDIVVLATPEIAGLPYVISGLVAAGGMAAAMSTADGLLLAIANALSHDLYYKIIDRLRKPGNVCWWHGFCAGDRSRWGLCGESETHQYPRGGSMGI